MKSTTAISQVNTGNVPTTGTQLNWNCWYWILGAIAVCQPKLRLVKPNEIVFSTYPVLIFWVIGVVPDT